MIETKKVIVNIRGQQMEIEAAEGENEVKNSLKDCNTKGMQFVSGGTNTKLGLDKEAVNVILNVIHTHKETINDKVVPMDCLGCATYTENNGVFTFKKFRHVSIPALFRKELIYTQEDLNNTQTAETEQKLCKEDGAPVEFSELDGMLANAVVNPIVVVFDHSKKVLRFRYDDEAGMRKTSTIDGRRLGEQNASFYRLNAAKLAAIRGQMDVNELTAEYKKWLANK